MKLNQETLESIQGLIQRSKRILLISHKMPDGDTLGSSLALYHLLLGWGKQPELFCCDPAPEPLRFLPHAEEIRHIPPILDYDAYFIVDAGAPHLTGLHESHPALFDKSLEVVNIDHHPSNEGYGRYNVVMPESASATLVIQQMAEVLDWEVDRHAATCLLTGLYTDTGSFMHSNTNSEALRAAAWLLGRGGNLRKISKEIFQTTPLSTLRLWGRVLKNTYQTGDGVTLSAITEKDFEDTGADYTEMAGVVDYVNSVPHSTYSVILSERGGKVKGSLRTLKSDVNVAEIAAQYGGGGHIKAAGFTLPGRLEKEIRWKVVAEQKKT